MNKFKKIGIFFFGISLLIGVSFANTVRDSDKCTASQGDRVGTTQVGVCNCPDLTKWMPNGTIEDPNVGGCLPCYREGVCCGIKLNTNVPFIGNCIELSKGKVCGDKEPKCPGGYKCDEVSKICVPEAAMNDGNETKVTESTAFPILMGGLTKILVTVIILMGFVGILAGGVMISASGGDETGATKGKKLIGNVVIALALLGASGVILRIVNPNFFG